MLLASKTEANVTRPYYTAWQTPQHGKIFETHFIVAENRYAIPHGLLSRLAYQESNYNAAARGPNGEVGLMQIIQKWHPTVNPFDPIDSIYYAARILKGYYNEFGNWKAALAAYNWGETNVRNKGYLSAPQSTKNYYNAILRDIGLL